MLAACVLEEIALKCPSGGLAWPETEAAAAAPDAHLGCQQALRALWTAAQRCTGCLSTHLGRPLRCAGRLLWVWCHIYGCSGRCHESQRSPCTHAEPQALQAVDAVGAVNGHRGSTRTSRCHWTPLLKNTGATFRDLGRACRPPPPPGAERAPRGHDVLWITSWWS